MDSRLPDRWASSDFPVLRQTAVLLEEREQQIRDQEIASALGSDEGVVRRSLTLLIEAGYLDGWTVGEGGGTAVRVDVYNMTERGMREVGLWPGGDRAEALVDALEQAAQQQDDPDERSRFKKAADALRSASRDTLVSVAGAVTARMITS